MASRTKIVFFGNERLATGVTTAATTLEALVRAGYDVVAVVTNYQAATSRQSRTLEIAEAAARHGIPVLTPEKPGLIRDELAGFGAKLGVLVAYGKIIPQSVIDLFPLGIINIHPSLLPLHRGPIPIEAVILDGSSETGVSIMQLSSQMDAGGVLSQEKIKLTGLESKQELADRLLHLGGQLMIETLPGYIAGTIKPTPQNEDDATFDQLIDKSDGQIDWQLPAVQIERQIRAYLGWPGSKAIIDGTEVTITAAHVLDPSFTGTAAGMDLGPSTALVVEGRELAVATGQNLLVIDRLKPAGKREMTGKDFLAGHPLQKY